ncbi:hypothetical protein HPB48_000208 [Haemaphysalis longicornis]|uniref:Fucosyltransferase n=1 Tax=Haemaphysalis longicornis TaxID=44386 RepID=A0A9J6FNL0_HAELO|nr:hypothetical protein HPB48_000208 [Haemaphysalis longicornis]
MSRRQHYHQQRIQYNRMPALHPSLEVTVPRWFRRRWKTRRRCEGLVRPNVSGRSVQRMPNCVLARPRTSGRSVQRMPNFALARPRTCGRSVQRMPSCVLARPSASGRSVQRMPNCVLARPSASGRSVQRMPNCALARPRTSGRSVQRMPNFALARPRRGVSIEPRTRPKKRNDNASVRRRRAMKAGVKTPLAIVNGEWTFPKPFEPVNVPRGRGSDSDIVHPSGTIVERYVTQNFEYQKTRNIWRRNSRMAVWAVSHCGAESRRDHYVKQLRKYVRADVYGRCGHRKCTKANATRCYEKFAKKYFFYLSFENSIGRDYVTEKLFNVLEHDIIPVLLGGANYTAIAPPDSFIDALSFRSPIHLAKYLKRVAGDFQLYAKYMRWKNRRRVDRDRGLLRPLQQAAQPIFPADDGSGRLVPLVQYIVPLLVLEFYQVK